MTTAGRGGPEREGTVEASQRESWIVWSDEARASDGRATDWIDAVARLTQTSVPVHRSKHAATYYWPRPAGGVYVKVYHRYRPMATVKDCVRGSKARRAARASTRLAKAGFHVPRVLAVAEERRLLGARRAWVATAALQGEPLAARLATLAGALGRTVERCGYRALLSQKRALLTALGREVARLHEAGFVAGDLVPANVWIAGRGERPEIVLLDHDRTRWSWHRPSWWRARRNLVQLNRVVLVGVSVTDRLRVFRTYSETRRWASSEARRRLPWIVAKTTERRRRFDKITLPDGKPVDFRALMRAGGTYDLQSGDSR